MKRYLLLIIMLTAWLASYAEPMKVKVIRQDNNRPVAEAAIEVEYVDTIVTYTTDKKGQFSFDPSSFPVTITARGKGLSAATVGLLSMPEEALVIALEPESRDAEALRKPDWSSAMKPRLSSTYTAFSMLHFLHFPSVFL